MSAKHRWISASMAVGSLLLLGVIISFVSTHRSVLKYLKMHVDDLY